MEIIVIFFYTLNSLSLLFTGIMTIISFAYYLHRKFMTRLVIYVFISETIHSLSLYLSFMRNSCFYTDKEVDRRECSRISYEGLLQTFFGIYSDIWTLTTCCCISFKIFDLLNNNSLFFDRKINRDISKAIIFAVPSLTAFTLILIQSYSYHMDETGTALESNGECLRMDCLLADNLTIALIAIVVSELIFILVITICITLFIKKHLNLLSSVDMSPNMKTIDKMRRVRIKSLCFPIICWFIWIFSYTDKFVRVLTVGNNELIFNYVGIFYGVFNGIRGILFSVLFYFTQTKLKRVFKEMLHKTKKENSFNSDDCLADSSLSMSLDKI